ncbi:MAG: GH3 auxin-responsive promoter family protein [Bacteroidota bacterium]
MAGKFKSTLLRPIARYIARGVKKRAARALSEQDRIFKSLIKQATDTAFGRDHHFDSIKTHDDFQARVSLRDYEALRPYVERIKADEEGVLWPGRPRYFAKTSGTTSGVKYIPITKDSLPNHFGSARDAVFCYVAETGRAGFVDGKQIFLSGSPEMEEVGGIPTGRLSGISNHLVPAWLKRSQMPSYTTNCIDDWETKVEAIVKETKTADLRLISGIPPWVQMYYERLLQVSGQKSVKEVFPNFELFVYGGVNFEPYRAALEQLTGGPIPSIETYPASEGFIAYQDSQTEPGLLLNTSSGIFFEFVKAEDIFQETPVRYRLSQVETGTNYAIIINSNAGLWGYKIGDTVEFVSLNPYRIRVTGRTKHFISAFGEHVIGKEVETALREVAPRHGVAVREFTVAPQVSPPNGGLPYHEWLIEYEQAPEDAEAFAEDLDAAMVGQNIYYQDLIDGGILKPLVITPLEAGAFRNYMASQGKLGGQNKVPRLSDDRKIAEGLVRFIGRV